MIPVLSSSSPVSGTRWRHIHCFETIFPSPLPRLELSVYIFTLFFLLLSGVGMISRKITSSVCFWTAKFWCQFIGARWNDVIFLYGDITVVLRSTKLIQGVRNMHYVRNDVFLPGNYFWTYETFDDSCNSFAVNFFKDWKQKVSKNLFMVSVGFLWIHSVKKPICQNSFWIRIKDSRMSICVSQADIRSNEWKLCSKCSKSYRKKSERYHFHQSITVFESSCYFKEFNVSPSVLVSDGVGENNFLFAKLWINEHTRAPHVHINCLWKNLAFIISTSCCFAETRISSCTKVEIVRTALEPPFRIILTHASL